MSTRSVHEVPPISSHDELTIEAVTAALRTIADAIELGVPLESIRARLDLHTSYHETEVRVLNEVRNVLIQHRDHGTIAERLVSRHGNVTWPVRQLPPGLTPEAYDLAMDRASPVVSFPVYGTFAENYRSP